MNILYWDLLISEDISSIQLMCVTLTSWKILRCEANEIVLYTLFLRLFYELLIFTYLKYKETWADIYQIIIALGDRLKTECNHFPLFFLSLSHTRDPIWIYSNIIGVYLVILSWLVFLEMMQKFILRYFR